ncbi:MAG: MBL fold metallo-hydrolase [Candidatus Helarchaeota archaeon]
MTTLTFYGGIATIGGNCVVLEEDGHRIMIDNGMCFSKENNFYKDFLKARKNNDIRDYIALGLLPLINGIYGKEMIHDICSDEVDPKGQYLLHTNLLSYEDYVRENGQPFIEAFLLSHAHLDHIRNLRFIDPEIPVICSQITYDLLKILSDFSDDYLHYIHAIKSTVGEKAYFPGAIKKGTSKVERNFIILEPDAPHTIGPFTITGFPTDHSLPGSMAFQVRTAQGKQIVYTGDLRFHGLEPDRNNSYRFVKMISSTKTDALITEGTRIDDEKNISEDDVYDRTLNRIKHDKAAARGLVLVSFPWKNLSRFHTVYRVARDLKRVLVIQPKLAYLIHNLGLRTSLGIADILKNRDLKIFLPRISSMIYSNNDYILSKHCLSYNVNWNKGSEKFLYSAYYGEDKLITAYQIHEAPEKYILHLQFYDLNQLIDLQPPAQSLYFNMKTEPFDEEGMIEQKILNQWIKQFHLNLITIHASGHAPGSKILEMIEKINPSLIFPIHTEKPNLFTMKNAIIDLRVGQPYPI